MGLQKGRLVGDQAVGGGVGLVEAVAGELGQQVEDLVSQLLGVAPLGGPGHEAGPFMLHDLDLFLAHGPAKNVGLAQSVPGQEVGHGHDLLLVDDDAVGLLEDGYQIGMGIGHWLTAVFAVHEVGDEVHRPRPVEGHQGDDLFEALGFEPDQEFLHARRLQLEDAGGVAPTQEFEGGGVVQGGAADVKVLILALPDQPAGVVDDGQSAQAQEVELYQPDPLAVLHGELGDRLAVLVLVEGQVFSQWLVSDDHPGGVGRGVAAEPFQPLGQRDEAIDRLIPAAQFPQPRLLLLGFFQGHAQFFRDQLGDHVHLAVSQPQYPAHVPDHRPGLHLAEGGDLGHVLGVIALGDVGQDLVALFDTEVDVDVGHGDPFAVQKALEEEVVGDGVQVGYVEGVGHQGAGRRAAPRTDRDGLVLGPLDEVGHDQEVAGEAHAGDDLQLLIQTPAIGFPFLGSQSEALEPPGQALHRFFPQDLLSRLPLGQGKAGKMMLAQAGFDLAALGDGQGVAGQLGLKAEPLDHLLGRAEIEQVRGEAQPLFIIDLLARLDGQQDVVGLSVFPVEVVAVVGGHGRQPHVVGQLQQLGIDCRLLRYAGVLYLDVEVFPPEDVGQATGCGLGLVLTPLNQVGRHLAVEAGREGDEALMVLGQVVEIGPRLVVEAVDVGVGHDLEQILIAVVVLGQQNKVVMDGLARPVLLVPPVSWSDIDLAADDGLDPGLLAQGVEFDGPVEIAVIGQGHGPQPHRLDPGKEFGQLDRPVQKRIVAVEVEVDEFSGRHGPYSFARR